MNSQYEKFEYTYIYNSTFISNDYICKYESPRRIGSTSCQKECHCQNIEHNKNGGIILCSWKYDLEKGIKHGKKSNKSNSK
jgi:hypothetical protein